MVLNVYLEILLTILADKLFAKVLRSLQTCALVNNSLLVKLVSSSELPIMLDERFKVTSVPFSISHFNLLNYELDNFTLKVLY